MMLLLVPAVGLPRCLCNSQGIGKAPLAAQSDAYTRKRGSLPLC
jgi:hypothetical protein